MKFFDLFDSLKWHLSSSKKRLLVCHKTPMILSYGSGNFKKYTTNKLKKFEAVFAVLFFHFVRLQSVQLKWKHEIEWPLTTVESKQMDWMWSERHKSTEFDIYERRERAVVCWVRYLGTGHFLWSRQGGTQKEVRSLAVSFCRGWKCLPGHLL